MARKRGGQPGNRNAAGRRNVRNGYSKGAKYSSKNTKEYNAFAKANGGKPKSLATRAKFIVRKGNKKRVAKIVAGTLTSAATGLLIGAASAGIGNPY